MFTAAQTPSSWEASSSESEQRLKLQLKFLPCSSLVESSQASGKVFFSELSLSTSARLHRLVEEVLPHRPFNSLSALDLLRDISLRTGLRDSPKHLFHGEHRSSSSR